MRRYLTVSLVVIALGICGCESHQTKLDELRKEHDKLDTQFRADCSAEYLKVPPTLSPKCEEEKKHLEDVWQRLQAEQTKQ